MIIFIPIPGNLWFGPDHHTNFPNSMHVLSPPIGKEHLSLINSCAASMQPMVDGERHPFVQFISWWNLQDFSLLRHIVNERWSAFWQK
jgi:hypothetical protein